MKKIYQAERIAALDDKVVCEVTTPNTGGHYTLENVGYHSPDGFEMGYAGSGPADLALTILLDHFGSQTNRREHFFEPGRLDDAARRAWELHQEFKLEFITPNQDFVTVTDDQIIGFVKQQERRT